MIACNKSGGSSGGGGLVGTRWQGTDEGLANIKNYSLSFTASQYNWYIMDIDKPFKTGTYEFDVKTGKGTMFTAYHDSQGDHDSHFTVAGNRLTQDESSVYIKK